MEPDTLLITCWGFTKNPFRAYVAEKERNTPHIFLEPPYFKDILGEPKDTSSSIVFGQRGDGKSTLCQMVEHYLKDASSGGISLVIRYVDFPRWGEEEIRKLNLEQHLER